MKFTHTIWRICLRKRSGTKSIIDNFQDEFILVPNPRNGWVADPFIVEKDNMLYIFAEIYDLSSFRGSIGYCLYANGSFSEWKKIVSADYHFSYPYIFEMNGVTYLMPEAGDAGLIPLYRCKNFPDDWEEIEPLYRGEKMADTTFLSKEYLISQHMRGATNGNSAVIFSIDNTDGSYKLNIQNEVDDLKDIHRPAGNPWKENGKVFRPAQNSSLYYGESLIIYQIKTDLLPQLVEEEIMLIKPTDIRIKGLSKKLSGFHTYNLTDNYEVIDVKYETVSINNLFRRFIKKLK